MNTPMTTIMTIGPVVEAGAPAERADELRTLAARWPQFSDAELRRLHFLAYRYHAGRLRVPTSVSAEVEALCAMLLHSTEPSVRPIGPPNAAGLPPLWAAWVAQQRAGRSAASGHSQ